ncbi:MAG TPA: MlaD family protein [Baekduia sp.]|uniref:MlaD family protein n=1 Tax=Baekduia sp. TaxID=2600305 RepID=UPI002D7913C5|nr:MlaD family protein [Baekduia sp.]HET6508351.1 MlaD family protein [Baekduia sp.]
MTRVRIFCAGFALAAAALVLVVFGTGAGDDHKGSYKVRAIFSNAFTVIPGEDVKISGVKVGSISDLEVTKDNKAAVVLNITEPGFKDFRKDATCTIRPQSLIGERFVECTPTQPKPEGEAPSPELDRIKSGAGKGQYLLPDSQTIKPVDIDLVGNIMRLPYRERLSIIINELGTGLAGNGDALREAIKQADPALEQTDKVLAILADQNKTLAQLAKNSDTVLAPLARQKGKVADFIDKADKTAVASAERRGDIEASLQKLPAFLRQLTPTMQRLGGLADQMTPVLDDLNASAPQLNQFIKQLGPFSQAGIPALKSLGDTADAGDQALLKAKPIVSDVGTFAKQARPLTKNLAAMLTSLRTTGGIERLMDFFYYQAAATNGYDSLGHYLRAIFVVTNCTTYVTEPQPSCSANFEKPATGADAAVARASRTTPTVADVNREIANGRSPFLARQDAVAAGLDPSAFDGDGSASSASSASGSAGTTGSTGASKTKVSKKKRGSSGTASAPISLPTSVFPGQASPSPAASGATTTPTPQTTTSTATTTETATSTQTTQVGGTAPSSGTSTTTSSGAAQTLLDYLLGG